MKKTFFCILLCVLWAKNVLSQDSLKNKIYNIVEEMPYLESCSKVNSNYKSKKACSDRELLSYLMSKIKLDTFDLYYSPCCNSYVSFVVNLDGKTEDIRIIKSINENFDSRLVKLIKNLPKWVPGRHRDKYVKVKINLPIRIKPK